MKKSSSSGRVNSVKNSLSVPNAFVTKDNAVVLATKEGAFPTFTGIAWALSEPGTDVRIFGKLTTRTYRLMAVALAKGPNALERARAAAKKISVV